MIKKESIALLTGLGAALEEKKERLEKAHQSGDAEAFNSEKKFILQIQKKIGEILEDAK